MSKVSRPPLGAPRGGASARFLSALRAQAALALALALLASLAPLGPVARAQGAPAQAEYPLAEESPVYVLQQTPDGDVSCQLATPAEIDAVGGQQPQVPLHQINHLRDKDAAEAASSAGLTIVLRGTSQLEANPEARQAFINAAAKWEALVSSPITVTIDVDYGTTFFGEEYKSANTLGATSSSGYRVPFSTVRQRLVARAPAGSEEAALLNNLPAASLPTDIGDVPDVFVMPSMMRALGISFNESTAPVPKIGFNSNFAFDFNPNDGVNSTQTDFDSVAVHEIGHALGFNSQVGARELDPSRALIATVWDFYRFRPGAGTAGTFSVAPRVLSSGTTAADPHAYFGGGAELALSTGKPDGTGGDERQSSHWKDDRLSGVYVGIMDPTIARGRHETISQNDLKAIDLFGYSVAVVAPPPPPANTPNPIDGNSFFVRQHYLDFLSREPEAGEPWTAVLNNCLNPFNSDRNSPSAGCDRNLVSSSFFRSPEFELKGRYAFRFYKVSFGRLPDYAEIVADMQQLTGATGPETVARRASFAAAWVQRADFRAAFDPMTNEEFVNALMNRYGTGLLLINSPNPSDPENGQKIGLSRTGMTSALNSGQWTRAQVLRAVVDSDEVGRVEFNPSFVAMQYYGYLRRAPETAGYNAWLNYLNANPSDFRTMVDGFMNSVEYRRRFGSQ